MSKVSITSKLINICTSLYSGKFPTAPPLEKFSRTLMMISYLLLDLFLFHLNLGLRFDLVVHTSIISNCRIFIWTDVALLLCSRFSNSEAVSFNANPKETAFSQRGWKPLISLIWCPPQNGKLDIQSKVTILSRSVARDSQGFLAYIKSSNVNAEMPS